MRARTSSLRSPLLLSRYRDTSSRESTALVISSSISSPDYTSLEPSADGRREFSRIRRAAQVSRPDLVLAEHLAERPRNAVGGRALADVAQHQERREQERRGVGHTLARDVGRAAVHRLEDPDLRTQVRARHHAETTHEAGAQVRHDVAIE